MKVVVVSANSLDQTGEATYFRHLVAGLRQLSLAIPSLEVEAYALNGRGKPLKYDIRPYDFEGIKYLPYKKFTEVANEADYVIMSTCRFKGDYSFLNGLTTPYGMIVHSLPSIEAHAMTQIWQDSSKPQPYINYVLDESIREKAIANGAIPESIFYVGLPFCRDIVEPAYDGADFPHMPHEGQEPYVIVPARIHFVKRPAYVAGLLKEAHEKIDDLVGVFFGGEDFFYHHQLKDVMESNSDFLTMVEPFLDEVEKAKWFNWATLAVDGTMLPKPPKRMQYTMMEAAHFGVPILVEEQRHGLLWKEGIQTLALSSDNIVRALQDHELRYDMALANWHYVNAMHDAKKIAHDLLAPIIYDWRPKVDEWERIAGLTEEG